jgi:hypothetical protein
MVLTAYSELSPAIGLFVTVASAMREHCRQLDASVEASGPHGFAVRLKRVRLPRRIVHRIPRPTFVTIAKRPSWWARDGAECAGDFSARSTAAHWHDGQISSSFRKSRSGCPESICQDDEWKDGFRARLSGAPEWRWVASARNAIAIFI